MALRMLKMLMLLRKRPFTDSAWARLSSKASACLKVEDTGKFENIHTAEVASIPALESLGEKIRSKSSLDLVQYVRRTIELKLVDESS